jgi:hypothetical protein
MKFKKYYLWLYQKSIKSESIYIKNFKLLMKGIKGTWENFHVHEWKDLALLEWPPYPKESQTPGCPLQNSSGIFYSRREHNCKTIKYIDYPKQEQGQKYYTSLFQNILQHNEITGTMIHACNLSTQEAKARGL